MEVSRIIAEIDAQISKLQQARELLLGNSGEPKPGRGRPRKNAAASPTPAKPVIAGKRRKRNLSEEARKRIADAQKRRWAEKRKESA